LYEPKTGNWLDVGASRNMGGLPVITIGWDGNIHGAYYQDKENSGRINFRGNGVTRESLLKGDTKLFPFLMTYPTLRK
jgi:hypothetical protein